MLCSLLLPVFLTSPCFPQDTLSAESPAAVRSAAELEAARPEAATEEAAKELGARNRWLGCSLETSGMKDGNLDLGHRSSFPLLAFLDVQALAWSNAFFVPERSSWEFQVGSLDAAEAEIF